MWEENVWFKRIGPDYVAKAFEYAHEADPEARLILNEFDAERDNGRSAATQRLVGELRGRGVPIHGVGLQCTSAQAARRRRTTASAR